jgi:hypothetical protein
LKKAKPEDLKPGTQIVYIPLHAVDEDGKPDEFHRDAEIGFVTSVRSFAEPPVAFCRYWSKFDPATLRTTANSEATPIDYIWLNDNYPQHIVDKWIRDHALDI